MRQLFSAARLETVEAVAKMLNDEGIDTYVSDGRSYKGSRRRNFSYRETSNEPEAGVWIVKAEDQARAREILREAGLIDSTRAESYRQQTPNHGSSQQGVGHGRWISRVRILLIAALVMTVAITTARGCNQAREAKAEKERHIILIDTSNT